jgi:hypothetical protein
MLITGPINGQLAKVAFESLFAFAVAGIASGIGHAGILGVTQVLGHLGFQRALDKAFGQLLEQAVLADEVFRFLLPASSRSINSLLTVMVHLSGCSAVSRNLAVYKKFKTPLTSQGRIHEARLERRAPTKKPLRRGFFVGVRLQVSLAWAFGSFHPIGHHEQAENQIVASRMIVRPFYKQMRMRSVPVFHGPHRCFAFKR